MSKKNNKRAHKERFNIIARAQIQNELKQSQKRLNKHISKSVFSKFGGLHIADKDEDIKMKVIKSKAPKGYIRRRDKKILDNIKKRKRKASKISGMRVD